MLRNGEQLIAQLLAYPDALTKQIDQDTAAIPDHPRASIGSLISGTGLFNNTGY